MIESDAAVPDPPRPGDGRERTVLRLHGLCCGPCHVAEQAAAQGRGIGIHYEMIARVTHGVGIDHGGDAAPCRFNPCRLGAEEEAHAKRNGGLVKGAGEIGHAAGQPPHAARFDISHEHQGGRRLERGGAAIVA